MNYLNISKKRENRGHFTRCTLFLGAAHVPHILLLSRFCFICIFYGRGDIMTSCELVTFVSSLACAISKSCNKDELSVLATVFTQLGDSLETILAHEAVCEKDDSE